MMKRNEHIRVLHVIFVLVLVGGTWCNYGYANEDTQEYIVYMGSIPDHDQYSPSAHHVSLLQQVINKKRAVPGSLIRTYKRSFNGFAAKLTHEEKQALLGMEDVVSIFPNNKLEVHTTRSWDFMGFTETVKRNLAVESDVIVGVIDLGIWPDSESFNDEGLGPIPKKWKGVCEGGQNFSCNKKLIGARSYSADGTAFDADGHGTHTASTIAGMLVRNASFDGIAEGTARGAVPSARIAAYKMCDSRDCKIADMLAAFDDAIADGVDIISISMGYAVLPGQFVDDIFSIAAFHAMEKNILTVQSAGNSGKRLGVTISVAPWVLSVGASNTDRRIINKVVVDIDNATSYVGLTINPYDSRNLPILYGEDLVTPQCNITQARICSMKYCLNNTILENNILMCDSSQGLLDDNQGNAEESTSPAGVILPIGSYLDMSTFGHNYPTVQIRTIDYELIRNYKISTRSVINATIFKSESMSTILAPLVAGFSSRGPNPIVPEILKPDIVGPGLEILAATPNGFRVMSGTSMSCPHVAGAAAYVKSFHPDWSASAIKSALMTTAWDMDSTFSANEEAEFSYGSGHVDPVAAVDPGLVYEASRKDYIALLFSLGYNKTAISKISGKSITEPEPNTKPLLPKDFNYPSMMAVIEPNRRFQVQFQRKVTNVGAAVNAVYKASVGVTDQPNVTVTVTPSVLKFNSLKKTKIFVVNVTGEALPAGLLVSASLAWSDGNHTVRSPVVIYPSVSAMSMSSKI